LLSGSLNPEHEFENGQTLLELVAGNAKMAETLLRFGARVTLQTPDLLQNRVAEEGDREEGLFIPPQSTMSDFALSQRLGRKNDTDDAFSGVCSRVFLAEFQKRHRCCVKIQNSNQGKTELHNALLQEQFSQEVQILKRLGAHPNIVSLLHHFSFEGSTVLVFPLIERNLSQQIKFRKLRSSPPFWTNWEFSTLACDLLEAVSFLQKTFVCHRDLVRFKNMEHSLFDFFFFFFFFRNRTTFCLDPCITTIEVIRPLIWWFAILG
jgi:hypothetical protein